MKIFVNLEGDDLVVEYDYWAEDRHHGIDEDFEVTSVKIQGIEIGHFMSDEMISAIIQIIRER